MDLLGDSVSKSLSGLLGWIDHSYSGWDPFDGLNSTRFDGFRALPPQIKAVLIQMHKVSPINLRPVFSVNPGIDTKGISLFLQSYCNLQDSGIGGPLKDDGEWLFSTLMGKSIEANDTIAWSSHYFDYVGVDGSVLTPDTPDLIGTTNAIRAICQYARLKDLDVKDVIRKYYHYLLGNFDRDHSCYYYGHHVRNKYVPNSDAEVISSVRIAGEMVRSEEVEELCRASLLKLIESQDEQGSWFYSRYLDGAVYRQLDFHQGYIIDGLVDALHLFPEMRNTIMPSLEKAIRSYDSLFAGDGRSFYRFPRRYPTDIHNQAQGIITNLKLYDEFDNKVHLESSSRICKWTIENMQDESGYFYYQKGRLLANKIPYMRWSQAWMMLALSQTLEVATVV